MIRTLNAETAADMRLFGKLTLTFTIVKKPSRGDVTVQSDGTFVYTPRKNKVGTDTYRYTAADGKGGVSEEATVTVEILKPLIELSKDNPSIGMSAHSRVVSLSV